MDQDRLHARIGEYQNTSQCLRSSDQETSVPEPAGPVLPSRRPWGKLLTQIMCFHFPICKIGIKKAGPSDSLAFLDELLVKSLWKMHRAVHMQSHCAASL